MKKDPGLLIPTDKTVPVMSPSGETKRMKLEKKKGNMNSNMNALSTPFTSFAASSVCLPTGNANSAGVVNSSSRVLNPSSSGGISDTGAECYILLTSIILPFSLILITVILSFHLYVIFTIFLIFNSFSISRFPTSIKTFRGRA